ncbi:MAG: FAD-dependent oxidoreductase [Acidimicrobiales bacterium]
MTEPHARFTRDAALASLSRESFDLLVIGGGITGAGVALDAASRGLKTALVGRTDFASGTSSKSSKMVHGGLRYLQQGEFQLVYEALAQRQRLLHNAPHLVHELPFMIPIMQKGGVMPRRIARILGLAMWQYDLTGGWRIGKRHKRLSTAEALELMPTLREDHLASAYLYYDAKGDDARITLCIARTAAISYGATMLNYADVTGFAHDDDGHVCAAQITTDDSVLTVQASVIVNATGVWSDETRTLDEGVDPETIRPAKGVHCTVRSELIQNAVAVVLPVPGDKRSVFVVPWGSVTYIGTTDTDYEGDIDNPVCTAEEVDYLLSAVNNATGAGLSSKDVLGTWAGLRPLVKSAPGGRTADLSRGHKVETSESGLISINGGKLTTYRHMAADTVNLVMSRLGKSGRSHTKNLRLLGATDEPAPSDTWGKHLHGRYGSESTAVLSLIAEDPTLAQPLVDGLDYIRAEALYAIRHEMAHCVADVLDRRTRARLWDRAGASHAAADVAGMLAAELSWTATQEKQAIDDYTAELDNERAAATSETDLVS